jgi:hypothetical protein
VTGATFAQARIWVPLYLLLAVASGFVDLRMRRYPELGMTKYTPEVVSGIAEAPGRYRVLMPFALQGAVRATGADPMTIWHLSRLAGFFASWVALHAYLRTWFPLSGAVAGTLLVAATLPLTFTNSWAHPDHIPELALFTLGCFAIARGRDALFAIALVAASLNRETAAFLVPLYLAGGAITRERLVKTAGFAAIWAAIYVGLRVARGMVTYDTWQLFRNVEFLKLLPAPYDPYARAYAWFGLALFGPLLYLALQRRGELPRFVRGALWIVPLVAVTGLLFSSIVETRIFTPLFPLIVPAVMFTVLQPKNCTEPSSSVSA